MTPDAWERQLAAMREELSEANRSLGQQLLKTARREVDLAGVLATAEQRLRLDGHVEIADLVLRHINPDTCPSCEPQLTPSQRQACEADLAIVQQALNDWAADFAETEFDAIEVVAARARIWRAGTVAYIAEASSAVRRVLDTISATAKEGER